MGFSYIYSILFRHFPSISSLLRVFIFKGCWILSNAFSASIEMIILFFILLMWGIIFIDLHLLNHSCIPGINPTLSRCCLTSVCWYFVDNFCIYIHQWYYTLNFHFLQSLCLALASGQSGPVKQIKKWKCFLLFTFLEWFEKD